MPEARPLRFAEFLELRNQKLDCLLTPAVFGLILRGMSQLHQMQVSYVPEEDRILFRINTNARQEFRFWMTRRYVAILWKSISGLIHTKQEQSRTPEEKKETAAPKLRDELIQSAEVAAKHKEVVKNADFQTQYQESQYLPLGEAPALLYGVGIKPGADGQPLLCLNPQQGEGIELALNENILHSLCKLIHDAAGKAEWGLDLKLAEPVLRNFPEGMN